MLLRAFDLFIELLTVKEMSCICHLMHKRSNNMVVAHVLKNHQFLETI